MSMAIAKVMDRRMWIVLLLIACGWLTALLTPAVASNGEEPDVAQLYAKQGTWAKTMVTVRASCAQQLQQPVVTAGYWFYTQPRRFESFSESRVLDNIDLDELGPDGEKCWKQGKIFDDGKVNAPTDMGVEPIYMTRTMTVDGGPASYPVRLACSQGNDLWLNGRKILSKHTVRNVERDHDRIVLDLKPGDNELVLKVYNPTGHPQFYFSCPKDPARVLWAMIAKDFPIYTLSLSKDATLEEVLDWFRSPAVLDLEKRLITAAADEIGLAGGRLINELAALELLDTEPGNARWLTLYERCVRLRDRFRQARKIVTPEGMRALRMAIEDLGNADHLDRLAQIESNLPDTLDALGKGLKLASGTAKGIFAFRREALLANPLLDFDRLLVVKRSADNLGLPQNHQSNYALDEFGFDNEIAVLSPVTPSGEITTFYKPDHSGFVGDVEIHYDTDKILFSMPSTDHGRWHVWEINADGTGLKQVTETDSVVQRIPGYGKKVEPKIKYTLVDDLWPKFLHPYPLSEKYFLVSSKPTEHSNWGIYLVDVFGNMLLLKEEPGYALFEPVPWRKTERPNVNPGS